MVESLGNLAAAFGELLLLIPDEALLRRGHGAQPVHLGGSLLEPVDRRRDMLVDARRWGAFPINVLGPLSQLAFAEQPADRTFWLG